MDAAVADEMAQALGEDAGLARTGRRNDPGRSGEVADGRQLVGREIGDGRRVAGGPEPAGFGIPAMHHRDPGGESGRLRRAAVDEERRPVGEQDVGLRRLSVAAVGEPPSVTPSSAKRRAALRPCHQMGSPPRAS